MSINENASPERIRELLDRNLQEVFGEADDEKRRASIDELWTLDAVLYVPPGAITGHQAISKFCGDLRATHPDYVYTPHAKGQILQNAGRLSWGSGPIGKDPIYTGWDVVITRDDKIAALYVFLDESSDEYRRSSGNGDT